MSSQPERAKRVEVGASQPHCALWVTAARGQLLRWRPSPMLRHRNRRAASNLIGHPPQAGPALVTRLAPLLGQAPQPSPSTRVQV
jgi:hypothetical protein